MARAPTTDPREIEARRMVCRDESGLAPRMQEAVTEWTADCNAHGYDVVLYETTRSEALGLLYFQLGRTHAPTVWQSWHAYGLAVDVISKQRAWKVWPDWIWADAIALTGEWAGGDPNWYEPVVEMAKTYNLHWGGDWRHVKDCPHFQWHCDGMYESPSPHARQLYAEGGIGAVWKAVNAI